MDARTPPVSRREVGKAERRRRIASAAASLVRESGFDAVSMVQIAERSGVAPATLYNLFQSKNAIFQQVFDEDLETYSRRVAEAPARDAIDRMFVAIDFAAALYRKDPTFYRSMTRVSGEDAEGLRSAISEPRHAFWQTRIANAAAEGLLRDVDPKMLAVAAMQLLRGVFLDWAARVISAERLAAEGAYGFALMLLPYATEASAQSLRVRLAELQKVLSSSPREERWAEAEGC